MTIAFLISLVFIPMLRPFNNLLYTQDSFNFFFFPFSNTNNPFISFYSHGGLLTSYYNASSLFLQLFFYAFEVVGINLEIAERIFIILTISISNFGLVLMFRSQINSRKCRVKIAEIIGILIYWVNPFTISVTYWHYLTWFLFQAIIPYIFYIILQIDRGDFFTKSTFVSLLVVFSYSTVFYGSYAGVLIIITIFAAFYFLTYSIYYKDLKTFTKKITLLVISTSIELYFAISLLLLYSSTGNLTINNITGGANSYASLISLMKANSFSTSPLRVLTLTAFGYLQSLPIVFAWHQIIYYILIGSIFVPILFVSSSMLSFKTSNYIIFLLSISVIFIIFSIGYNFPFSGFNLMLLKIGGPFLILTNAFYFTIQVYILTLSFVTFIVLSSELSSKNYLKMKKFASDNYFSVKHKTPRMNTFRRNLRFKKVLYLVVIFGAAGVLVTSSFPVLVYGEYESIGPMESSFKLPSDFQELRSFFENNFTSPEYYTLILPLSRVNAVYMKIGNGTFPDPSNLFQSYIPYPVIDWAQTNTSICIDNKLTELPTII